MKTFKTIKIFSDGSFNFVYNSEASDSNKFICYLKQDEKTFSFNQKKIKTNIESKQSSYYKKKYLKK